MKIKLLLLCSLFFLETNLFAQDDSGKYLDFGIEAQQYPTGFLLGIRSEIGLNKHHAVDVRIGYNLLDHQDFGVQEDEKGGGFGFTLGYRYYFQSQNTKWFLGARSDLWFNEVDWKDNIGQANEINGTTDVVVLQPTAIGGYRFLLNDHWVITPTLAFGAEINIKTDGEEVGQGSILLWGLNIGYQF